MGLGWVCVFGEAHGEGGDDVGLDHVERDQFLLLGDIRRLEVAVRIGAYGKPPLTGIVRALTRIICTLSTMSYTGNSIVRTRCP